jgi:hypothetical protein
MTNSKSRLHPQRVFAERPLSLWGGLVVVCLGGIAAVSTGVSGVGPETATDFGPVQLAAAVLVGGVVGALANFVEYAVLVRIGVALAGDAGSEMRSVRNIAWSLAPLAAANVAFAAAVWLWLATGPGWTLGAAAPQRPGWLAALDTATTAVGHAGIGYVLWYGVRDAHDVTRRRAAVVAAVAVAGVLALNLVV